MTTLQDVISRVELGGNRIFRTASAKVLLDEIKRLSTVNAEMKQQLDIATDLGDKRWKEIERLQNKVTRQPKA